jgi:hypothetical protein
MINKVLSVVLSVIFLLVGLSSTPFSALAGSDSGNLELGQAGQETLLEDIQDKRLVARELTLAELSYKSGMRVVFSYDESSGEYGLLQEGLIGESDPLVDGEIDSLLATFLAITPENVPVPELLLAEAPSDRNFSAQVDIRKVSPSPVNASQLELPITTTVKRERKSCPSTHFSWFNWHDSAVEGLAPKQYYSSQFDGKNRYTDSYIANCTPVGSPSWLWARHRIYYKNVIGNYVKHFEGKVAPGFWQEATKGSVKRYRQVAYDDGWNSSPNCGASAGIECKYTREGRFYN